jgi:hypothetical protein
LSRDLLTCAIAYDIQQRVHGGLRPATQRRLRALAETPAGKADPAGVPVVALKPGTRLVREWHGRVHTVAVLEHGFDYEGEIYHSLTQIARRITGAHWLGPVFFGLRTRARQVRSATEQADE